MSSQARPFNVEGIPQLVDFKPRKRSFTLHLSKSKSVDVFFNGTRMIIPAVWETSPHSDTDADGEPIPGTFVVEDMTVFDETIGDEVLFFDATKAIRHILGITPGSDGTATVASSPYALGGLSVLPRHATKAQWKAVAAAGEKRAFVAEVENARAHLRAIDEANGKRKDAGRGSLPIGPEEERARMLIEEYNKIVRQETPIAPHRLDEMDEELEMEAFVKAAVKDLATRAAAGRDIDRVALAEELLKDPSVRKKLQTKYQIRKRGNAPVDLGDLEKAESAGLSVEEAGLEGEGK